MNHKKIILNKLFPCPPSKKYDNLMIDNETISYITTPINSDTIAAIIRSHIPKNIALNNITIMDATACVGGDTIAFANSFGNVIAIEIDRMRFMMLTNNLKEFELFNVVPINGNCIEFYKKINCVDIIYFDPPWGGKKYKEQQNLRFNIGDMFIDEIINDIFSGNIRSHINMIVFKLPINYDLHNLYMRTKRDDITIYMHQLNKMNIIVYKKNDYK